MDHRTQTMGNDPSTLGDDAQALLTATADVAGQKVGEARKSLAAAQQTGKKVYNRVRDQAIEGAMEADQTIRKNPYQSIGVAFGVGALLGYLVSRRGACNGD